MSLYGTLQGTNITATLQSGGIVATLAASLPIPSAPTLTAVDWPSAVGLNAPNYAMYLFIDGATSPQTLQISISYLNPNDGIDFWIDANNIDESSIVSYASIGNFNAASGQLFEPQMFLSLFGTWTGTNLPPRTVELTVTHVETATVLGTIAVTFNPAPE